jgi:hypothetical protein
LECAPTQAGAAEAAGGSAAEAAGCEREAPIVWQTAVIMTAAMIIIEWRVGTA